MSDPGAASRTTKTKVVQLLTTPGVQLVGAVWRDRDGRYWVAEELISGEGLVLSEVSPGPSPSLSLAFAG